VPHLLCGDLLKAAAPTSSGARGSGAGPGALLLCFSPRQPQQQGGGGGGRGLFEAFQRVWGEEVCGRLQWQQWSHPGPALQALGAFMGRCGQWPVAGVLREGGLVRAGRGGGGRGACFRR
jgi:hypothetical protein